MKMNYLLKSKPNNIYRFTNIIIISVFAVLIILSFIFPNTTKYFFDTVSKPIWNISDGTKNTFGNIYNFLSIQNNLVIKNKNLGNQVDSLNLKVIDYDTILKENQDLKSMLGRKDATSRVLARVLSLPPQSPYDTLVIDVGLSDGIQSGDKVYISNTIIIGLTTSVALHTSTVELFSTGDRKMQVILERTGASYDVVGRGGSNFSIESPKEADILWGDVFTYPGLTPSVVGSVYYIDTNSQSSFKTIFIRIPGNVFQSKWVFVEKNF